MRFGQLAVAGVTTGGGDGAGCAATTTGAAPSRAAPATVAAHATAAGEQGRRIVTARYARVARSANTTIG